MPEPLPAAGSFSGTTRAALDAAFVALETYDAGSSRAALWPIDEEVRSVLGNALAQLALERRLIAKLRQLQTRPAREYVCSKLGLLGSELSVSVLEGLLADPALGDAARRALEMIPLDRAVEAFRRQLNQLTGVHLAGVITSLGERRDAPSAPVLAKLATAEDPTVADAAVAALGRIGSPGAARALAALLNQGLASVRLRLADATLECATRLLARGDGAELRALYRALAGTELPNHVRQAAQRLRTGNR